MAWRIEYTETASEQRRKLDQRIARQIVDFTGERIASLDDPRSVGKALVGPLGGLWCWRVGDCRLICEIRDGTLVTLVVQIGNRREVCRK